MKTKQRFRYSKQPMKVDLTTVESSELLHELMNRVTRLHPAPCYFIDQTTGSYDWYNPKWNIHAASGRVLVQEK